MENRYQCREVKRCHTCGLLKESYAKQPVKCYEQNIFHYYCEEHAAAVPPVPEPECTPAKRKSKPTGNPMGRPKRIQPAAALKFLLEEDIDQKETTFELVVLSVIERSPLLRSLVNRKIAKEWGGRIRPKLLTATLRVLVNAGAICRSGGTGGLHNDERYACYALTGVDVKLSPPKPKQEKANAGTLRLRSLYNRGFSDQGIVLAAMTKTSTPRALVNAEISRKHGGKMPSRNLSKALDALVQSGKIQRSGNSFGEAERHASYCLSDQEHSQAIRSYDDARRTHTRLQSFSHRGTAPAASASHQQLQRSHS